MDSIWNLLAVDVNKYSNNIEATNIVINICSSIPKDYYIFLTETKELKYNQNLVCYCPKINLPDGYDTYFDVWFHLLSSNKGGFQNVNEHKTLNDIFLIASDTISIQVYISTKIDDFGFVYAVDGVGVGELDDIEIRYCKIASSFTEFTHMLRCDDLDGRSRSPNAISRPHVLWASDDVKRDKTGPATPADF